ncbi:hypothetical protein FHG64_17495 [Antarcticibacterium flavum]|uniref:Uncharacterized protein n=1 Tax=Antarcticibacterium flavum TaxID=2058175 RepID=A0A5B7X6F2_9FLAO|nr:MULTISPECIES: hypothetical protein [Antarcticibacterium]MCM4159238.1 hypothetical protein [Antarcticibacterium sp. W02-3]QCY71046.1 hypothetical protein FHG64_17495 [Antarcticibacterium flavum]
MNSIKQRKMFETRAYKLDPGSDFVEVDYRSSKEKLKYRIHLLEVGTDIQYEADNLIAGKIVMVIMAIMSIASVVFYFINKPEEPGMYIANAIVWGGMVIIGILIPNKDDLIIANGSKVIRLFRNKPDETEALNFANFLIEKSNKKKKETLINFELPEDQFNANIHWLQSMNLIDKDELAQLQADFSIKKLI